MKISVADTVNLTFMSLTLRASLQIKYHLIQVEDISSK